MKNALVSLGLVFAASACSSSADAPTALAEGDAAPASLPEAGAGDDAGAAPDARPTRDGGHGRDAGLTDTGRVFMDECKAYNSQCADSKDPSCGKCEYRVVYDAAKCSPSKPCDNLVLVFSAMGCDKSFVEDAVAANGDVVGACVQPLAPGELLPSSLGGPQRDTLVMSRVFDQVRGKVWTGKNLLMAGCSAGASRYPVIAARTTADDAWRGTAKTAVCMSDGVVDIAFQDEFVGAMASTSQSCKARHQRIASSYTSASASASHSCSASAGGACACDPAHVHRSYAGDCAATGGDCVAFDSIVGKGASGGFEFSAGVAASSFAVQSWKLISEGSAFEHTPTRCDDDVVPEAPFKGLCGLLDADPTHSCVHVSQPNQPHCAYLKAAFQTECVDWFKGLP